ncbi:MAG: hypothetical protein K940chlam7_00471 [Chlamydiae bacterium]|nr:hypothetical protein [Chlamydiota bacterium]
MTLEEILNQYSKKFQLGKLELNKEGICHLVLNDSLFVALEKSLDGKGFYLYTTIGRASTAFEKALGLEALSGNLFGKETGHASLGYEPNTQTLVLFEYFSEEITFEEFDLQLKRFAETDSYWMERLEEVSKQPLSKSSLQKHVKSLENYENMQIFFA